MTRAALVWLVLLTLLATPPAAAQFSVEQVLSSPFPTELVAAPNGSRVAWVFDHRGARNIWVADGPDFNGRQLTRYSGDDGQAISTLRFTPDGNTILFARGSETNSAGEVGDPTSGVEERKQQVWALEVGNGTTRLLGEMNCRGEGCEDLQVSPDGRQVVWAARRQIWIAPLSGAEKAKALFFARGSNSDPRWSPDGKRIAFVSDRQDHRFIGIFTFGQPNLRWIAPSVDRDGSPRWSEDGKRLAFIRTRGRRDGLPILPLRPSPWAIWVAEIGTGAAREIWRSGERRDDSLPPWADEMFHFSADDRIVFPSEQDGRYHLYSLPASGGKPVQLTRGAFDVEEARLSADGRSVLFTSNQDDVDRRHIWRVSTSGGTPAALTRGSGIEWRPVETGDGKHVVCIASGATQPAMPHLITPGTLQRMAPGELLADFPAKALVTPEPVVFKSEDGFTIHGQLFLPREKAPRMPAVIFMHGGPPRHMMLGFHNRKYYHHMYAANQYLASRGFVVLSVNYRLGNMYGRAFRQPERAGWRGASEYRDIVAAAKYLQSLPYVDGRRIGLWGGSYGGYLTALGLARNSDLFAAGVDVHGVHDWSARMRRLAPENRPPDWEEALRVAWESSPVASMATWRSPVLLIHGDDDRNVAFSQTTDLAQRLREQNLDFEQLVFPDELHSFLLWRNWVRAFEATGEFFAKQLKLGTR